MDSLKNTEQMKSSCSKKNYEACNKGTSEKLNEPVEMSADKVEEKAEKQSVSAHERYGAYFMDRSAADIMREYSEQHDE